MLNKKSYYPEYLAAYEINEEGRLTTLSIHNVQTPERSFYAELNTVEPTNTSVFGQISSYNSDGSEMGEDFAMKGDFIQIKKALERWCDKIVSGKFTLYTVATRYADTTEKIQHLSDVHALFKNTKHDTELSHTIHLYTDILKAYQRLNMPVRNVVYTILAQGIDEISKQDGQVHYHHFDSTLRPVKISDKLYNDAMFMFKVVVVKGELSLESTTLGLARTGDIVFRKKPTKKSYSGILLSKFYEGNKGAYKASEVSFKDGGATYVLPDEIIKPFNEIGELVFPGQEYLASNYKSFCSEDV